MDQKNTGNTGFRNDSFFCYNCGGSCKAYTYPLPVSTAVATMKQFVKEHENCKKTWEPPVADPSWTMLERAAWWKEGQNGERGRSSEAMWSCLYYNNGYFNKNISHPLDPDDFRRCHLLLETVPEWRKNLNKLKTMSPEWERLVQNWDMLTIMLLEQMSGKKNDMFKFMQQILSEN